MMKQLGIMVVLLMVVQISSAQCLSGDCVNGRGKYKYPSGAVYNGEFKNGEIHGIGELRYSDGRRYVGQWSFRYQEGAGTMTYPDGKTQKGYWKKGQFLGDDPNGTPVVAQNEDTIQEEIQIGCVVGNCEDGEGTFVYADGSKYEGKFKHGKFNGFGSYFYANGDKYIGEWKDSYYHGEGTKHKTDGAVVAGLWQNGEFIGDKMDNTKKGCIAGNCENGDGTFVYSDGSRYMGSFKSGNSEGFGICYYANGNKYSGSWRRNNYHGDGTMYYSNGDIVRGMWDNGNFLGAAPPSESELEALAPSTNAPFDPSMKIYAVMVGVAKYNHMPTLNYTDDDAYRMYAFLMSPSGGALADDQIRILIDEDATKKKIVETMQETFSKADSNDMVLLYFSGHGFKGAFLPFDFDGYNNKLFHSEVKTIFNSSPAKFKLCIADACHSGSLEGFAARGSASGIATIASYYNAFKDVKGGTALLLSSKAEETSLESSGLRQGIFSHFLVKGLKGEADKDKNDIITVRELFQYVHDNVRSYTGNWQTPLLEGDFDENMPVGVIRK